MKNFIKYSLTSLLTLNLIACGGGSSSSGSNNKVTECLMTVTNNTSLGNLPTGSKNICDFNINILNTIGESASLAPNQESDNFFLSSLTGVCRAPSVPLNVRFDGSLRFDCS